MLRLLASPLCALFLLAACTQQNAANAPPPTAVAAQGPLIVVTDTILRLAPSDDAYVTHPQTTEKMVSNFKGQISRGQIATIKEQLPSWTLVVLDDDATGWIHTNDMMPAANLSEATLLRDTVAVGAPSANAPVAARFAPGTLLLVADEVGDMSKVYGDSAEPVYVPTKELVYTPHDLGISHLLVKMRMARQAHDLDEASELLDEARLNFASSPLIDLVADNVDFLKVHEPPITHHPRLHPLPATPSSLH